MSEVGADKRTLRVSGRSTQEEIRVNANAVLDGWPTRGVDDHEADMAEAILALLDLLEASQDLIEHLTEGES